MDYLDQRHPQKSKPIQIKQIPI